MLTKKQKTEWVAALRSGDYKQVFDTYTRVWEVPQRGVFNWLFGRTTLQRGYCALGVLDAITGNWLGHMKLHGADQGMVIAMNDRYRKSFSEIADWIEENVKTSDDEAVA